MKRPQTLAQRRKLRALARTAQHEADAAVDRAQKATSGNKRAHERSAVWAVKKALDLGPACPPKERP